MLKVDEQLNLPRTVVHIINLAIILLAMEHATILQDTATIRVKIIRQFSEEYLKRPLLAFLAVDRT